MSGRNFEKASGAVIRWIKLLIYRVVD